MNRVQFNQRKYSYVCLYVFVHIILRYYCMLHNTTIEREGYGFRFTFCNKRGAKFIATPIFYILYSILAYIHAHDLSCGFCMCVWDRQPPAARRLLLLTSPSRYCLIFETVTKNEFSCLHTPTKILHFNPTIWYICNRNPHSRAHITCVKQSTISPICGIETEHPMQPLTHTILVIVPQLLGKYEYSRIIIISQKLNNNIMLDIHNRILYWMEYSYYYFIVEY